MQKWGQSYFLAKKVLSYSRSEKDDKNGARVTFWQRGPELLIK